MLKILQSPHLKTPRPMKMEIAESSDYSDYSEYSE